MEPRWAILEDLVKKVASLERKVKALETKPEPKPEPPVAPPSTYTPPFAPPDTATYTS